MSDQLATIIREDVERLCSYPDRDLGTPGNRSAVAYVTQRMREIGLSTRELGFEVPQWCYGQASVTAPGISVDMHPGPYSPAADDEGPLIVIRNPEEIDSVAAPGAVLLLCGEIAQTQFTPRAYPFYSDPDHAAILGALEAARPSAVLAATGKSLMTGAMSPFPLIEEVGFAVPSAYMTEEDGARLAEQAGQRVRVLIDSEVCPSTGEQPTGRLAGASEDRVVVCAHVDSKPRTPGALDNAAGVAVLLAVAELLRDQAMNHTVEFVPFNGEDHVLAPGELAWLSRSGALSDIRLAVNIDGAGLAGAPSAYSLYGVDATTAKTVKRLAQDFEDVDQGPEWPASDHMIFAMRGIPAMALTSMDFFGVASIEYSHTPADTPAILDYDVLADTARFIATLISQAIS